MYNICEYDIDNVLAGSHLHRWMVVGGFRPDYNHYVLYISELFMNKEYTKHKSTGVNPLLKKCSHCGNDFPIEDFKITVMKGKEYRKPYCKACTKIKQKESYQRRKEKGDIKEEHYERDSFTIGNRPCF